jgi:hypothetical protein
MVHPEHPKINKRGPSRELDLEQTTRTPVTSPCRPPGPPNHIEVPPHRYRAPSSKCREVPRGHPPPNPGRYPGSPQATDHPSEGTTKVRRPPQEEDQRASNGPRPACPCSLPRQGTHQHRLGEAPPTKGSPLSPSSSPAACRVPSERPRPSTDPTGARAPRREGPPATLNLASTLRSGDAEAEHGEAPVLSSPCVTPGPAASGRAGDDSKSTETEPTQAPPT